MLDKWDQIENPTIRRTLYRSLFCREQRIWGYKYVTNKHQRLDFVPVLIVRFNYAFHFICIILSVGQFTVPSDMTTFFSKVEMQVVHGDRIYNIQDILLCNL